MRTLKLLLGLLLIQSSILSAQEPPSSIFDEGVDREIRRADITPEMAQWAANTALKFKEVLKEIKLLNPQETRTLLVKKMQESVTDAKEIRELLLMRYALDRALYMNQFFGEEDFELAVIYVLLPAVKAAISLYERADLPYLTAYLNTPNPNPTSRKEIENPPYALFAKAHIGYFINISNMHKAPEGQFHILQYAMAQVWHDIMGAATVRQNSTNASLCGEIKDLYFLYENRQPSDITNAELNRIRTLLLKTSTNMVTEKTDKVIVPFMAYSPAKPSILFRPLAPAPAPNPPRIITRDYATDNADFIRPSIGFGKINDQAITTTDLEIFTYSDRFRGVEGYIAKTKFDMTDIGASPTVIRRKLDVGTGRYTWAGGEPADTSTQLSIGPYLNVYHYDRNELTKLSTRDWFALGLSLHAKPLSGHNFYIDVNAYWNLGASATEGDVEVDDFGLENASSDFKAQFDQMKKNHYDQETQVIKTGQDKAQSLIQLGYPKYTYNGREFIRMGRKDDPSNDFRIPVEGDRTQYIEAQEVYNREIVDHFTVEASCTLVSSLNRQDDLILECGGYLSSPKLQRFDGRFPQLYAKEFNDRPNNTGSHVSLVYRLWDQTYAYESKYDNSGQWRPQNNQSYFDHDKPLNYGPTLHLTYELDEDVVGREIIEFFNPEFAKDRITKTKTLQVYIQFKF